MKLYAKTDNGELRKVKATFKCIDGKPVKLKKNTPEWYKAVNEAIRQVVLVIGS